MDKYEYKVRADEIKELISQGEYVQAAEIADTIDWRRVKSVMMLCTISDLYKINRRYEDARDLLLLAYERRPGGRTICYSLCELSIKMEEIVQAMEYYKEFVQVAPKDAGRYILQYKLYEFQDVSLEERIQVLEDLKRRDYREKWAYELAYLYHRVGLASECVEECDELILWFGEGKYVVKAMELKLLHCPLTPEQQYKYDHRFDEMTEQESYPEEGREAQGDDTYYEQDQQYYGDPASDGNMVYDTAYPGDGYPEAEYYGQPEAFAAQMSGESGQVYEPAPEEMSGQPEDELNIHVKTMDVGQYNTINLQAELAEGLKEVLASEPAGRAEREQITRTIMEPVLEPDTESSDAPQMDGIGAEDLENAPEEMEGSEVFFGETGEIGAIQPKTVPDITAEIVLEQMRQEAEEPAKMRDKPAKMQDKPALEAQDMPEAAAEPDGGDPPVPELEILKAEPPRELARVLSQESDGQISLVLPESTDIEKQITGQMNIEDILAEWERMKKENEEKRKEEVRQHVLRQTGNLFNEFEASVRDGLLEKLEKGKVAPEELDQAVNEALLGEKVQEEGGSGLLDAEMPAEETEQDSRRAMAPEAVSADEAPELPAEETCLTGEGFAEEEAAWEDAEPAAEEAFAEEEAAWEDAEPAAEEAFAEEEAAWEDTEPAAEEAFAEEEAAWEDTEPAAEEAFAQEEAAWEDAEPAAEEAFAQEEAAWEDTEPAAQEVYTGAKAKAAQSRGAGERPKAEEPEKTLQEAAGDAEYAKGGKRRKKPEEEIEEQAGVDASQEDSAESDRPKVRPLTREEKELYAPFIQSRSAREQLVKAIDKISMASYTGNLIVAGEEGMDTLTLAKNIIREIQMTDSNFSGKVAKITGEAFNGKDPEKITKQLENGALIIQNASAMNDDTVNKLYKSLQPESLGIVIVLEDTRKAINKLLERHPQLKESFNARMDVEPLSNDTLVAFGKQYAREQEFSIDELGILALHTRIQDKQTIDHVVTVVEVKEIMDEAIRHASRKTLGHFMDILFARRYDEEDMIILTEKDFVKK